jgi:Putative glutamine amidotransferase
VLQRYVAERGGGLLMLGGQESFREGGWARTPVGEMLPVYLDRAVQQRAEAGWHWRLTREGRLQPWARLRDNEAAEEKRMESMPAFTVLNGVETIKPGASVITRAASSGAERPALAAQRFGDGKVAALTTGDVWRWGMPDPTLRADMEKNWRQLIRWLIADVPGRIDLSVVADKEKGGQAMKLIVKTRDKSYRLTSETTPRITVQTPDGNTLHLAVEPDSSTAGIFTARITPRDGGPYIARAEMTDSGVTFDAATGWAANPGAEEFESLRVNRILLETIARTTGGEVVAPEELDKFAAGLPNRRLPVMETTTLPLWHTPLVFAVAVGCLIAEWGLRRRNSLP